MNRKFINTNLGMIRNFYDQGRQMSIQTVDDSEEGFRKIIGKADDIGFAARLNIGDYESLRGMHEDYLNIGRICNVVPMTEYLQTQKEVS